MGRELWYCGDELMTAGSYMGDEGWGVRGESPATFGAVGVNLRNSADCILSGAWDYAAGEFEVAAAAGDVYFVEDELLGLLGVFPNDWAEDEEDLWGEGQAEAAPRAREVLESMASTLHSVGERIELDSVAGQALARGCENLRRLGRLVVGLPASPAATRARTDELPPDGVDGAVLEALAQAGEGSDARRSALRQLTKQYHPDQNPGREEEVLATFRYLQDLREQEK